METLQTQLFQTNTSAHSIHDPADSSVSNQDPGKEKPVIGELDHHLIDIIASYIRRLPDNKTRKHIARIIINTVIKSANL
jgi:hypothetical protein